MRTPPQQFAQEFIRFYFNHRNNGTLVQTVLEGFRNQGINMDSFYWMDSELGATTEDLKMVLKDPLYDLPESEIEKLLSA